MSQDLSGIIRKLQNGEKLTPKEISLLAGHSNTNVTNDTSNGFAFTVDGNRGCGRMHLFSCHGARREFDVKLDPGEALSVVELRREDLILALADGRVAGLAELASLATVLLGESSR